MVIQQGDVFWVDLPPPLGSEPGYRRPGVVIQNDLRNRSKLGTTVLCLLTTNLDLGHAPGNVPLSKGDANLAKRSVVNTSQIVTVDKHVLSEKIGTLSKPTLLQVLSGVLELLEPSDRYP